MRNMQIRFNGGPKDGCVLAKPINSNLDSILALYAVPPVGRYEVVVRSPGGQHVIVAWKETATSKTPWVLTEEAAEWRRTLDDAVERGTIPPALREAVMNPEQPVALVLKDRHPAYPLNPHTWNAATSGWNAALAAVSDYVQLNSNKGMSLADLVRDLERMKL